MLLYNIILAMLGLCVTGCTVTGKETCSAQLIINACHKPVSCLHLLAQEMSQERCLFIVLYICCCLDHSPSAWRSKTWVMDYTIWTYTTAAQDCVFSFSYSCSLDYTDTHINRHNEWSATATVTRECVDIKEQNLFLLLLMLMLMLLLFV